MASKDKPKGKPKKKATNPQPAGRTGADAALVALLAAGVKYEDAAVQADVSVSTIMRRLKSPAFRDRVERAREDFLGRALGVLAEASVRASTVIGQLMDSADGENVRLAAARAALELVVKLRDHVALSDRMRAIEQRLGTGPTPPPPSTGSTEPDEPDDLGDE